MNAPLSPHLPRPPREGDSESTDRADQAAAGGRVLPLRDIETAERWADIAQGWIALIRDGAATPKPVPNWHWYHARASQRFARRALARAERRLSIPTPTTR